MPTPSPIKQRIQELVPEIMELGLGCEIQRQKRKYKLIDKNYAVYEGREGKPYFFALVENEKILGRPITLADVLRAIDADKGWPPHAITAEGLFLSKSKSDIRANAPYLSDVVLWNLSTDFDGQSDECKRLIGELLGVKPKS